MEDVRGHILGGEIFAQDDVPVDRRELPRAKSARLHRPCRPGDLLPSSQPPFKG
jgi:hypothetical protein